MQEEEEKSPIQNGEVKLEDDENLKALKFIWSQLEQAQARTGAFSMDDCEQLLNGYNLLLSFLNALNITTNTKSKEEGGEPTVANQLIFNAYGVILTAVQMQQAKGIYTIVGATHILKELRVLKANLEKIKDPSLELKELKDRSSFIKNKDKKKDKKNK